MVGPFRIEPQMRPENYKSYQVVMPRDSMIRAACEDVSCDAFRLGWQTFTDERTELGMMQAAYIRQKSGRTFREQRTGDGMTVFTFEPGQRCFAEHQTRPQRFIVRGGDHRGNPRGEFRQHAGPADWVEDMSEHLDRINTAIERG